MCVFVLLGKEMPSNLEPLSSKQPSKGPVKNRGWSDDGSAVKNASCPRGPSTHKVAQNHLCVTPIPGT